MDKSSCAILLIEFQKTWTEKGLFHNLINKQYKSRDVLTTTMNLIRASRKSGVKVIQAPLILDKSDKSRYKKTPLPARLLRCFTKGTWKAEFTDGIYEVNDIIIKGRFGFDACEGSDLEEVLHQNGIKKVFVCGFTTDHCVKETIKSLSTKGFESVMVSDCTVTRNASLQKSIEKQFVVVTAKEIVKQLANLSSIRKNELKT